MNKVLFTLFAILLTATSIPNFKAQPPYAKPYGHVVVDTQMKPFWNRFVKLMDEKDIPVDYGKGVRLVRRSLTPQPITLRLISLKPCCADVGSE